MPAIETIRFAQAPERFTMASLGAILEGRFPGHHDVGRRKPMTFSERAINFFRGLLILTIWLLVQVFSVPAYAQVAGGTILGTTGDPSGATIPNASVSIKNVSTGVVRSVTTDSAGFYSVPNLLPGPRAFQPWCEAVSPCRSDRHSN